MIYFLANLFSHETYPHISFNKLKGRFDLYVPLSRGERISTDNTCKAATEIRDFFNPEKGALKSLAKLIRDLIFLKDFYNPDSNESKFLTEQIIYLRRLIFLINKIRYGYDDVRTLHSHSFPKFPAGIRAAIEAPGSNGIAITTCPRRRDEFMRFTPAKLAFNRPNIRTDIVTDQSFPNRLWHTLCSVNYQALIGHFKTKKEHVIKAAFEQLKSRFADDAGIIASLPNFTLTIRDLESQISQQCGAELLVESDEKIKFIYESLLLDESDIIDEGIYDGVLAGLEIVDSVFKDNFFISFLQELTRLPINVSADTRNKLIDNLHILIQIFIHILNLYLIEKNLISDTYSLAHVIELSDNNITVTIDSILSSITFGNNPAVDLFHLINFNREFCGINRVLTEDDLEAILSQFDIYYSIIKEAPHHDEHFIVLDDKAGDFTTHQGRQCLPFQKFAYYQVANNDELSKLLHELNKFDNKEVPQIFLGNLIPIEERKFKHIAENHYAEIKREQGLGKRRLLVIVKFIQFLNNDECIAVYLKYMSRYLKAFKFTSFAYILENLDNKYHLVVYKELLLRRISQLEHLAKLKGNDELSHMYDYIVTQGLYSSLIEKWSDLHKLLTIINNNDDIPAILQLVDMKKLIGKFHDMLMFFMKLDARWKDTVCKNMSDLSIYLMEDISVHQHLALSRLVSKQMTQSLLPKIKQSPTDNTCRPERKRSLEPYPNPSLFRQQKRQKVENTDPEYRSISLQ